MFIDVTGASAEWRLLRRKVLRDRDGKPAAQPHAKSQDQTKFTAAGARRRQRIDAQRLSHDHRICQIVKLLEQIARAAAEMQNIKSV